MSISVLGFITILISVLRISSGLPSPGKWTFNALEQSSYYIGVPQTLYKGSYITIKVLCDSFNLQGEDVSIEIGWVVRQALCYQEYIGANIMEDQRSLEFYYTYPACIVGEQLYNKIRYLRAPYVAEKCHHIIDLLPANETFVYDPKECSNDKKVTSEMPKVKRSAVKSDAEPPIRNVTPTNSINIQGAHDHQVQVDQDGAYLLILHIRSINPANKLNLTIDIEMRGQHGYLSAEDWPLLIFYGVMCGVYVFYAVAWLIVSALQLKDLLRIQFWIGGVIFIGMIEKAVFYAEYQSINSTGISVQGAILFAEILSCLKKTIAYILVIIVSLGFGIIKPRLGTMLHRVVGVGAVYFITCTIEGCFRVLKPKTDSGILLADIPLSLLDSAICWWIFSSLMQTVRTLRLRKNLVKLSLYRHFSNTLIFAVIVSLAFMIWAIHNHKLASCITDWKELWWEDAFWHLLFSLVLLVIMILWRPTNNNQRYAYTPLIDGAEDQESLLPSDAFDGMKLRGLKSHSENSSKSDGQSEDDLKWVEENIPPSITDSAFSQFMDSDEEIMTAKFEQSKME